MSNQNQNQKDTTQVQPLPQTINAVGGVPNYELKLTALELKEIIIAAIRAGKEPTEDEKLKAELTANELAERKKQFQMEAEEWKRAKEAQQANCDHTKPNKQKSFVGKLFSDGVYRVMCLRCQKIEREIEATPEMIQQVLQAESLGISTWENFRRAPNSVQIVNNQADFDNV